MKMTASSLCWQLGIGDPRYIEIESKWRVSPEESKKLLDHLDEMKGVKHEKRVTFFDQYLDTAGLDLLGLGASLRLRYRKNGSQVYLQYKGPGFRRSGLLYRSEFSSNRLVKLVREESHHDIVRFTHTSVREILQTHAQPAMAEAMRRHLGNRLIDAIDTGHLICQYQKDKFTVDQEKGCLEPSVDRVSVFHISQSGPHAMSTFFEYENEAKSKEADLELKLEMLPKLKSFDAALAKRFGMRPERFDKYRRCASCFLPLKKAAATARHKSRPVHTV
jgi:inorganic triphosphatase YgiF